MNTMQQAVKKNRYRLLDWSKRLEQPNNNDERRTKQRSTAMHVRIHYCMFVYHLNANCCLHKKEARYIS